MLLHKYDQQTTGKDHYIRWHFHHHDKLVKKLGLGVTSLCMLVTVVEFKSYIIA